MVLLARAKCSPRSFELSLFHSGSHVLTRVSIVVCRFIRVCVGSLGRI